MLDWLLNVPLFRVKYLTKLSNENSALAGKPFILSSSIIIIALICVVYV